MNESDDFRLELLVTDVNRSSISSLIKPFRSFTGLQIAEIKSRIENNIPFHICNLFHNDHEESSSNAIALLHHLQEIGIAFEIMLDGEVCSEKYIETLLEDHQNTKQFLLKMD